MPGEVKIVTQEKLNHRKSCQPWAPVPIAVVESPSLEGFKRCPMRHLEEWVNGGFGSAGEMVGLGGCSNLKYSVILIL